MFLQKGIDQLARFTVLPIIKGVRIRFGRINLWEKIFIGILILLIATLAFIASIFYRTMSEQLILQHMRDTQVQTIQANTIMDLQLSRMEDNTLSAMQDYDILYILEELDLNDPYQLMSAGRKMRRVLGKYFSQANEWIYAYNIISHKCRLGNGYIPIEEFFASQLASEIIEANGRLVWHPVFDFAEIFQMDSLSNTNMDFRHLFSLGRVFRGIDTTSGESPKLLDWPETYILLLCFRESFFQDIFMKLKQSTNIDQVFLIDSHGKILVKDDQNTETALIDEAKLRNIAAEKEGTKRYGSGEQGVVLSYDTSAVTGWTLVTLAYEKQLLDGASKKLSSQVISSMLPLSLISLALACLISYAIAHPMRQLFKAIERTGNGEFTTKIPVRGYGEFARLSARFNTMNDCIAKLIKENYQLQILEKQAQLSALNAQLNPHFLYNTLNLINCMAIDANHQGISHMVTALSSMLRHTIHNMETLVLLRNEIECLRNYLYIMQQRFEDQLVYTIQIDPIMLDTMVPHMFLQPIVENVFLHAFCDKQEDCRLLVTGKIEAQWRRFDIIDNGSGMSDEQIESVLKPSKSSVGLNNTYSRIHLLYGEKSDMVIHSSPGKGTSVCILLPLDNQIS